MSASVIPEKHGGELADRSSVRLWLRMLSCTAAVERTVKRRLETEFGTTLPRFDVLAALERSADGMTMGELSRALLVSNGNVTGIVRRLTDDGLVAVVAMPADRRSFVARLTAEGRTRFAEQATAHHGWIDALFGDVSAEERDALFAGLGQLRLSIGAAAGKQEAK